MIRYWGGGGGGGSIWVSAGIISLDILPGDTVTTHCTFERVISSMDAKMFYMNGDMFISGSYLVHTVHSYSFSTVGAKMSV